MGNYLFFTMASLYFVSCGLLPTGECGRSGQRTNFLTGKCEGDTYKDRRERQKDSRKAPSYIENDANNFALIEGIYEVREATKSKVSGDCESTQAKIQEQERTNFYKHDTPLAIFSLRKINTKSDSYQGPLMEYMSCKSADECENSESDYSAPINSDGTMSGPFGVFGWIEPNKNKECYFNQKYTTIVSKGDIVLIETKIMSASVVRDKKCDLRELLKENEDKLHCEQIIKITGEKLNSLK